MFRRLWDRVVGGNKKAEPDWGSQAAKARYALHAAVSDLQDARSECAHLRTIARQYEDRARTAERRATALERQHETLMLETWAKFGVQGGGDRHRPRGKTTTPPRIRGFHGS